MADLTIVTNLRIPRQEWTEIKVRAAELGISANQYIITLLRRTSHLERFGSVKTTSFWEAMTNLAKIPQGKQKFELSEEDEIIYDL